MQNFSSEIPRAETQNSKNRFRTYHESVKKTILQERNHWPPKSLHVCIWWPRARATMFALEGSGPSYIGQSLTKVLPNSWSSFGFCTISWFFLVPAYSWSKYKIRWSWWSWLKSCCPRAVWSSGFAMAMSLRCLSARMGRNRSRYQLNEAPHSADRNEEGTTAGSYWNWWGQASLYNWTPFDKLNGFIHSSCQTVDVVPTYEEKRERCYTMPTNHKLFRIRS